MVFSQTSLTAQSILKVVEIDRLKPDKNHQQANGWNENLIGENNGSSAMCSTPPCTPPSTSFSEVYLKTEPLFENTMLHETDCEFFQDLVPWCSEPAKEELVLTTDSLGKTDDSALNTDTSHTPFSPTGWDLPDPISPATAGFYNYTPNVQLSPHLDEFTRLDNRYLYPTDINNQKKLQYNDDNWNINDLPVVLESQIVDLNPPQMERVDPYTLHSHTVHNKMLYNEEDSLDLKLDPVIPREVENYNNDVISEIIVYNHGDNAAAARPMLAERRGPGLTLNVTAPAPWAGNMISTPDIVNCVDQWEKEKYILPRQKLQQLPSPDTGFASVDTCPIAAAAPADYEPISTPETESHLESDAEDTKSHCSKQSKRRLSEDSDATYTPDSEYTPTRKYKKKRPSIPIKQLIEVLESQQQTGRKRGRPPKRRPSTVSSVCSVDDNSSTVSTHEVKYRELRDKNNEASKRSRMNRKLKELQMEQLAIELEERNKKLKVKADILEDMTKRLKDALMTAIITK